MTKLIRSDGEAVLLGEPIGRGGEATVFQVAGHPDQLAKVYTRAARPNDAAKLGWMVVHPPENPTLSLGHESLAWPLDLLYGDRRRLVGYLMAHIQKAAPLVDVYNPRLRAATMPQFDRRYLHRAARNLSAALSSLHRDGYVVGDLNESNILVTPSALVTLIDTDSFQVQETRASSPVVHYCLVGKVEYTPPELQGKPLDRILRTPEQDDFALGVLVVSHSDMDG